MVCQTRTTLEQGLGHAGVAPLSTTCQTGAEVLSGMLWRCGAQAHIRGISIQLATPGIKMQAFQTPVVSLVLRHSGEAWGRRHEAEQLTQPGPGQDSAGAQGISIGVV